MATQPVTRVWYNPAFTLGRLILVIGALIVLAAAFGWIHGDSVNVFELGVGVSFAGLAIG